MQITDTTIFSKDEDCYVYGTPEMVGTWPQLERETQIKETITDIHRWSHTVSHFLQQPSIQFFPSYLAPLH